MRARVQSHGHVHRGAVRLEFGSEAATGEKHVALRHRDQNFSRDRPGPRHTLQDQRLWGRRSGFELKDAI